jgi:hypothetical protein
MSFVDGSLEIPKVKLILDVEQVVSHPATGVAVFKTKSHLSFQC